MRSITWALFSLSAVANAMILHSTDSPILRDVWQFPNDTWIENIAVRSNGQLLVTLLTVPELYQVDPAAAQEPKLVYRFPQALGLFGIAELETDVFGVISSNFTAGKIANLTAANTPGAYSLWTVDARSSPVIATKVTDVREGILLNGMTRLDDHTVLVADSEAGLVWRIDTRSGEHIIAIDDPLMKPVPGIDGLHVQNGVLYFTSTSRGVFASMPIYANGTAKSPARVVAPNGPSDDFTLDAAGNAYVTTLTNTVQKITPKGNFAVIAGNLNSSALVGCTAAQFGRTESDRDILYVTTNGGLVAPVNGTYIEGGKIVAVDTRQT